MDLAQLTERLRHVAVTTVTPFGHDGKVDYEAIPSQVEAVVEAGVRIIVPCGNTGEFGSLGQDEVRGVVEATVDAASDDVVVVAGVGGASVTAQALASQAEAAGAHAVMVHHPTHTYIDRSALGRYYERIMDAVDIGVVVYKRGPQLTDELLGQLAQHEQVVGVKYAVNDVNAFAALLEHAGADQCAWLCGTAERWAPFFHVAGAHGFTSGVANIAPRLSLALHDALQAGDLSGAMDLRRRLAPFEELRQARDSANNVPAVKEGLRQLGLDTGVVRDPLGPLAADEQALVTGLMRDWGVLA